MMPGGTPNLMIVNPSRNVYLAVNSENPAAGSQIEMLQISAVKPNIVSAFWTFSLVPGGTKISLAHDTSLSIDIDATDQSSIKDGTGLVLSTTPRFTSSDLWSVGSLATPGTVSQIESFGAAGDYVIDSGSSPTAKVWTDLNNEYQDWQVLSLK